jgi:hypothetical protein
MLQVTEIGAFVSQPARYLQMKRLMKIVIQIGQFGKKEKNAQTVFSLLPFIRYLTGKI